MNDGITSGNQSLSSCNESGSSLLSVIVILGIVAVLLTTYVQYTTDSLKNSMDQRVRADAADLKSVLKGMYSCRETLARLPVECRTRGTENHSVAVRDGDGQIIIRASSSQRDKIGPYDVAASCTAIPSLSGNLDEYSARVDVFAKCVPSTGENAAPCVINPRIGITRGEEPGWLRVMSFSSCD